MTLESAGKLAPAKSELLTSCLDVIDTAIVIFDEDHRAIFANNELFRLFPGQRALVESGATLEDMLIHSYRTNEIQHSMSDPEIIEHAAKVATAARLNHPERGGDRLVPTANGRIMLAKDFRMPGVGLVSTRVDVTAMERGREHAELLNQQLTSANARLERFAAMAAHDLRAPIQAIRSLPIWIMEDLETAKIDLPESILEQFHLLTDRGRKLHQLVEDLLAYSKLSGAKGRLERLEPLERLRNIVDAISPRKPIKIHLPEVLPAVSMDPAEFDIVFRNLITNAIQHQDRNEGNVWLTGTNDTYLTVIEVADDGPGLPGNSMQQMSAAVARADEHAPGARVGMGLSFVRAVAERMGGALSVRSREGERGIVFSFSIPH